MSAEAVNCWRCCPTDAEALADHDADDLDAKLADIELIATEMLAINNTQRAILDELARRCY